MIKKYVLILDLCNNVIAKEIIRSYLMEDFEGELTAQHPGAAGYTSAIFCFWKVSPIQFSVLHGAFPHVDFI